MKNKGNEYFQRKKKALGDGKRAMILEPMWAKGHYRFCDALFLLGEHQKALLFNRRAQDACASDQEGHKDLLQQLERFQTELQDSKGIACVHHEGKPDRFKDMKSDMSPRKPKKSTPVERTTPRTKLKAPEKENTSLELSLTELDKSVLLYGYATALLETGQPEELAQAEKLLTRLESSERKFQCLVHYGLGRVYLKENMFAKALERFSNALLMIQRNITPGKLTWPTSRTILQETQPAWLKEQLENLEQLCKFPPNPDAEFLKDCCLTPDCSGRIRHIIIFDSTGLVKCEFKATIPKIRAADRPRFKQQCSSIKKLKCKSDRKLRRKQQRLAARLSQQEKKEMISSDDFKEQIPLKGRASPRLTVYMDCVLNQLHQNRAMFEEEEVSEINMSCFLDALQPWLGLCVPECVLGEPGGMKLLVEVLLESRSRVCVRVFIQTLADKGDAQPRLQRWAQKINNAGLIAAEGFLSRHAALLSSLNFSHLLTFTPLLECLRDHLKSFSALSDSKNQALKVMEHLQQAPAKDKRLFIWSLEAHRQFYDSIHIALDQYFEDGGYGITADV
ncbi:hypothetical protein DNTS_033787 [Danionella cerebrum]|uniref:E3 ubiquitin-protein ligase TTC3/DZIP3 domain-containing protein n=1 Tax=Danionella cerebrum TaxID=2873325 RepID=A0A553R3P4_9TELE|nr:hypothetical protein DNTS_033787 [Danionella translucida]